MNEITRLTPIEECWHDPHQDLHNRRASTVRKSAIAQRSGASVARHPAVPELFSEAAGILAQIPAPDGQARSRAVAGVSGLAAGAKRFAGVLIRIGCGSPTRLPQNGASGATCGT
jgi:hypothetical protein